MAFEHNPGQGPYPPPDGPPPNQGAHPPADQGPYPPPAQGGYPPGPPPGQGPYPPPGGYPPGPGPYPPPGGQPPKPKSSPWIWVASLGVGALLVVALIVVVVIVAPWQTSEAEDGREPATEADSEIEGVQDYVAEKAPWVEDLDHVTGKVDYPVLPPAGGNHNPAWQTCNGVAYEEPIPNEHAVHSLEHGAVWITYRPDLAQDDIDKLTAKVTGKDYTLMSPYEGLESPISLQAWGYVLTVDDAGDNRIDAFLKQYRVTAGPEQGATCSGGVNVTGDTPVDPENG